MKRLYTVTMTDLSPEKQWREGARKAINAAKHLLESGDYELALFTCHLAVEKALKAKIVAEHQTAPPKSHNLLQLSEKIGLLLSENEKSELRELSSFAEFARYGDETWVDAEATEENVKLWLQVAIEFISKFLS